MQNFANVFPDKDLNEKIKYKQWTKDEKNQIRLTATETTVSEVFFDLKNFI